MKLTNHTNPVESGGIAEISAFQIKTSSTAFHILSSSLYSNKIKAVIRELSCNAMDSHIEAGTPDLPFKVHLPNGIEPHFSVKDFGIGLSHGDVMGLYTTYFKSTKADSNDYTGALGLGSKSPFCYTENFTVISIHGGMQRTYTALIDEKGCPNIALMHETESTEHNGVEVKFAVTESTDFFNFKKEASQVLRWFKVMPKININKDEMEIPALDSITDDIDLQHINARVRTVATQGNVAYPIDESQLRTSRSLTTFQVNALNSGFVLKFAIGELDVAASREELSYIEETIEAVYQKLVKLEAHFTKHVMTELRAAGSKWDTGAVVAKMYSNPVYRAVLRKCLRELEITMNESAQPSFDFDISTFKEQNLTLMQFVTRSNGIIGRRSHSQDHPYDAQGKKDFNAPMIACHSVKWTEGITLYINDTTHGASDIIKGHMVAESISEAIVINRIKKTGDTPDEAFQKAVKLLGSPAKCKLVLLSSMIAARPKLAPAKRTVTSTIHLYVLESGSQYRSVLIKGAGGIDVSDSTKTFYYFPVDENKNLLFPNGDSHGRSFARDFITNVAHTVLKGYDGCSDEYIFGVGPRRIEEIKKAANWVSVFDGFAEYLNHSRVEMSISQALPGDNNKDAYISKGMKKTVELLDTRSPFAVHWRKCQGIFIKARASAKHHNNYGVNQVKTQAEKFGIKVTEKYQMEIDAALADLKAIEELYPMLGLCEQYHVRDSLALKFAEYIELVDLSNKVNK